MTEQKRVTMYFPADKKDKDTGEPVLQREVGGEGPKNISVSTVRFWCRHTRELKGRQVSKAEKFVRHECLHYLGNNRFVCLPLNTKGMIKYEGKELVKVPFGKDYNSSEYLIDRQGKTFRCSCQGWETKRKRGELVPEGVNCSHVLALFYAFKLGRFRKKPKSIKGGFSE